MLLSSAMSRDLALLSHNRPLRERRVMTEGLFGEILATARSIAPQAAAR
jgi:hypothetical protein